MAALLDGLWIAGIEYTGRATHIKKVAAYVGPGSRLKYRQSDIENICEFLGNTNQKIATIEKLVAVGLKQYPFSPLLNFRAALLETGKGFFSLGSFRARQYLETALKLAQASTDPKENALVTPIKKSLTLLSEMEKLPLGLPSFGGGSSGFPFAGFADFFDDFDDDDDDDDDGDGDDFYRRPASIPRPARGTKKPKGRNRR
jgi:hypothetical protein